MELLRIPYTGSGPLTQSLVLNKGKMGELLSAFGIKTPKTYSLKDYGQSKSLEISYPAIVKPSAQGSSAGITEKSIVYSDNDLKKQINYVVSTFNQEALIQPFIDGREITVSLLGNPPEILPLAEFNFRKMPKSNLPFLPYEWDIGNFGPDFVVCPAKVDKLLVSKIKKIVIDTWKILNIRDYCRMDLRINKKNEIFLIDVNSPPSLVPPEIIVNDPFPLSAKRSGLKFGEMLEKIIVTTVKRYGLKA